MLKSVNVDNFIECIKEGKIFVDFDARTGHNHGTKFRIRFSDVPMVYSSVKVIIDAPSLK